VRTIADPTPDGIPRPELPEPEKVLRWDRPKPPHDWRFWVGGTGRVLMVVGLLMFGFVAYQLWGTGLEYRASQRGLEREFEQRVAELAAGDVDATSGDVTGGPATNAPPTTAGAPTPSAASVSDGGTGTSAAPTTAAGPATTLVRASTGWPKIALGDVLAVIEIPKIGKTVYAVAGIRTEDLQRGLGHYPDTPLPGQLGNAAFAGHRTTYGAPLFSVDKLVAGDEIRVRTVTGKQYVYRMVGQAEIVSPGNYSVITGTDPGKAMLTLTSCHPRYSAKKRIVVHAELDPSQSGPIEPATPFYGAPLTGLDAPDGGDDPTLSPGAAEAEPGEVAAVDEEAAAVFAGYEEGAEALSQNWFHDAAAWPQVALWAAVLLGIVIAGYLVDRRFHRYWPGIVMATVPFVVALYFFYQNVNRLLPPDL
jgi:sortase A